MTLPSCLKSTTTIGIQEDITSPSTNSIAALSKALAKPSEIEEVIVVEDISALPPFAAECEGTEPREAINCDKSSKSCATSEPRPSGSNSVEKQTWLSLNSGKCLVVEKCYLKHSYRTIIKQLHPCLAQLGYEIRQCGVDEGDANADACGIERTPDEVDLLTRVALIADGRSHTVLRLRRAALANKLQKWSSLSEELHFSALIIDMHPKAAASWTYRRYLLSEECKILFGSPSREVIGHDSSDQLQTSLNRELIFFEKQATHKPKNYYAWHHLLWLFRDWPAWKLSSVCEAVPTMVAWQFSGRMVALTPFDFAAFHHRLVILRLVLDAKNILFDPLEVETFEIDNTKYITAAHQKYTHHTTITSQSGKNDMEADNYSSFHNKTTEWKYRVIAKELEACERIATNFFSSEALWEFTYQLFCVLLENVFPRMNYEDSDPLITQVVDAARHWMNKARDYSCAEQTARSSSMVNTAVNFVQSMTQLFYVQAKDSAKPLQ